MYNGQKFIENTFNKVKELIRLKKETKSDFLIEIDGGVNLENAKNLIDCGADVLVAGSSVFKSKNPIETIKRLKNI